MKYVPILKAKLGEHKALKEAPDDLKKLITPLFEIVDITWDYENDKESKSINAHLSGQGKKISDSFGENGRIFVDSNHIDEDRRMKDGETHHLQFLFDDFRDKSLDVIPVTSLRKSESFKTAVKEIIKTDNKGLCLRIGDSDLETSSLQQVIETELSLYNLNPTNVDLVFDLGSISSESINLIRLAISTIINSTIPYIGDWRSFTLASTSFPENLSSISGDSIERIDRLEWRFWKNLENLDLIRYPSFGDYGIAHPDIFAMDPRMMTISASIRYTADTDWVIVKGRSTKKKGYQQFPKLCKQLIELPEYEGSEFSWGDSYIKDCAEERVGYGNMTTWRAVGNNHHFHKTISQLAN